MEIWRGVSGVDLIVQSRREETAAFGSAASGARTRFAENTLVQSVLDDMHGPGAGVNLGNVSVDRILSDLERVADVVEARCDAAEANEFKRFLMWFGDQIARASSEGIVDTTLRVSQKEQKFLRAVRETLRYQP